LQIKINWVRVREISISLTLTFLFIHLFFLVGMGISSCPQEVQYFLEVIHRNNQTSLLVFEVYPEEYFYLEYTNSRDLNPVIDVFQVAEEGYFYLLEERYPWYGVGQEYHQSKEIYFKDGMVVVKPNKKMKRLPLRVAYTVEQILKVKKQEYLLSNLAERGEPIDILITVQGGQGKNE
jgi:hypothetical protein